MELFTEDHSKLLLNKEWLPFVDNQASTPYLIKFYASSVDLTCCALITDTKSTWSEVMTSKQISRRWRHCNSSEIPNQVGIEEEDAWRSSVLDLLAKAHTLGCFSEFSFEVVQSRYADFALEMSCDSFKWRWETCSLGYKLSAELISKHLIFPLISVNHLAFASADAVGEMADADLEKAVDKLGRTARRTVDTHIKHALSKPRISSTIRRMTAMFNFSTNLPAITSSAETPDLDAAAHLPKLQPSSSFPQFPVDPVPPSPLSTKGRQPHHTQPPIGDWVQQVQVQPRAPAPAQVSSTTADPILTKPTTPLLHKTPAVTASAPPAPTPATKTPPADSETESEDEDNDVADREERKTPAPASSHSSTNIMSNRTPSTPPPLAITGGGARRAKKSTQIHSSDSDSSPIRPVAKKARKTPPGEDEDEDSEAERRRRVAQLKNGAGGSGVSVKRGARQPIKRGGKRF